MNREAVVEALIDQYGKTYAEELGIDLRHQSPSALFQLLCAALLYSARISAAIATRAALGISRAGWTTAERMRRSTWDERVRLLNEAGYARHQERTATTLGDVAETVERDYGGDLRTLRRRAGRDPAAERHLLEQFKGLGDAGVDVFFREVQVAWDELRPFVDRRALRAARHFGLGSRVSDLQQLAGDDRLPRLAAALVRADLEHASPRSLEAAGRG